MKTKNVIIVIVVVLIMIIGGYFFFTDKSDDAMMESETMMADDAMREEDAMTEDEMMDEGDEVMMGSKGSYEAYAPEKLVKADEGDVVLFFRASWCPTCRTLDADIKANMSNIPDSVTILDVDYDNSTELKQKYGVTYQHTLVQVDSDGNMITKWQGSPTLAALLTNVE